MAYKVKANLECDGRTYKVGDLYQGPGEYAANLVKSGVLVEVDGPNPPSEFVSVKTVDVVEDVNEMYEPEPEEKPKKKKSKK